MMVAPAAMAETAINATTLVRFEQRSLPGFDKQNLVPATQFLSLASTGVGDPNLSIYLSAWGRVDLADKSTAKDSDGTLSYGYLRYLFPKADAEIKAGRFFVFEGVSSENIDGVFAKTGLAKGFAISAFGGAPVHPASSVDNRGNSITGGRFSYSAPSYLELGVSTVYEKGLISGPLAKLRDTRQLVGGDLWLKPHAVADLKGRISYDTINQGIAEQSWLLGLKTGSSSTLTVDYSQFEFKELFAASSIRSLFNPDTPGGQKKAGFSYSIQAAKPLELTAAYHHTEQDQKGPSDRFGLQGRLNAFEDKGIAGLSYNRVNAPSGVNSYHETRAFLIYTTAKYSASIDGILNLYDEPINGKKNGFEVQGSAGYRLKPNLNLSFDLSFAQNPAYNSEVKGLARLSYNYDSTKGAAK
jgi:hypothetical protein